MNTATAPRPFKPELHAQLREARERTLELIGDLSDEQMIGPRLDIVNPLRWEIGHVGYFQEYWILRHFRGEAPFWPDADRLYDSARIAHDTRWDLPIPSKAQTLAYIERILEQVTTCSTRADGGRKAGGYDEPYFTWLSLMHEYMHAEAITYTRQTLGYPVPKMSIADSEISCEPSTTAGRKSGGARDEGPLGDVHIPGGTFVMGGTPDQTFVFDNEQRSHAVNVRPFRVARTAVSNAQFAAFVEDNGYQRSELWSSEGWRWRGNAQAEQPVYWRRNGAGWLRRNFDKWVPLEPSLPVIHVNWYEADAYCRWAKRRLPTEAEWEMAASADPGSLEPGLSQHQRLFPWGNEPPTPERANLDWRAMGCLPVDALPAGDSAFGCRQMIGNVWEWTASDFGPYPGFSPGPYKEYSAPWFGDHKALRGGCWVTRSGLIRNAYRNYYQPQRRDVWAGFRTCAL